MFCRPVVAGLVRSLILISSTALSVVVLSVGTASAETAASPASSSAGSTTHHVLGMPVGTLSWALLGLVILVSGLVAASRSGQRSVVSASAASVLGEGLGRDGKPGQTEAMGDFGRSVTAV